ncbi:type I secretion system permease/ATPase [Pseudomonas sp. UBA4194]|uniref:type I secretion system permease/ATPase n=1 Tax=Pseudomonas sp. UBA4194 TaxID=1947317 RepID=UPI0025FCEB10|nr:type I secretion system permease/ATPase [Pseudomonas sp. UBA4194]
MRLLCAHHGRGQLVTASRTGERLTSARALQLLTQAGFCAGLVRRPLAQLPEVLLPAILLGKGQMSMLLVARSGHPQAPQYSVVVPGRGEAPVQLSAQELAELYVGQAILARPELDKPPGGGRVPVQPGHWLAATLWRYRGSYCSAAVSAVLINLLALAGVFFTLSVYDRVVPHRAYGTLWSLAAGVGLAMLLEALARWARSRILETAGRQVDLVVGAALFRQALAVRMEHKPASSGAFAHQVREVEAVREFITSATLATLSDLPFCVLFIGVIFAVGGALGWVPLISAMLILLVSAALQWPLAEWLKRHQHETSYQHGVLIEAMDGLETIKALGGEAVLQNRWETLSALASRSGLQARGLAAVASGAAGLVQQLQTVALVVLGVYLIDAGALGLGALVATVMLAGRATAPLGQVVGLAVRWQQMRAALTALNRLMALPVERPATREYQLAPPLSGQLSVVGLRFAYPLPGEPRAPQVLQDVSLDIRVGERVAIIGAVGCGKSTLLRVLARLYQPLEGRLSADGVDVQQIDPADWRAAVCYVGQQGQLFQGTLRDNLLLGKPEATAAELLEAMRLCGVDKLAARHPLGINLPVGEQGEGLSGGERQLVCLARGLLKKPRVLLLDEPTSTMDTQTERVFLRHLRNASAGQTLVLATHRPAALALVDRVIVLQHGRVIADGPRDQVLANAAGSKQ